MAKYSVTINGIGSLDLSANNHMTALDKTIKFYMAGGQIYEGKYTYTEVNRPDEANACVSGQKISKFYNISWKKNHAEAGKGKTKHLKFKTATAIVLSYNEFTQVLRENYPDKALRVDCGMDGVSVWDDETYYNPSEEFFQKLARYFGVKKVTSIHHDGYLGFVSIWICYEA